MKTITTFLAMAVFCLSAIFAQTTNESRARELIGEAVQLMDNGKIEESLKLLAQAEKLDPGNPTVAYETGYAYMLQKDFDLAIKTFAKLSKKRTARDIDFAMWGNCLDMNGEPDKALKAYDKGLKKFPLSGKLYTEKGIMLMNAQEYEAAVQSWETGIHLDPDYPSNYYWASRLYAQTPERVWALIYGEVFINLEKESPRGDEISKLMFETYQKSINKTSDTSVSFEFSKRANNISIPSGNSKQMAALLLKSLLSFELNYEMGYSTGILFLMEIVNLATLDQARAAFVEVWMDKSQEMYPNPLFAYHQKLIDAGHFTAYNYWLMREGNSEEFETWYTGDNAKAINAFMDWYKEHPFEPDEENKMSRYRYLE